MGHGEGAGVAGDEVDGEGALPPPPGNRMGSKGGSGQKSRLTLEVVKEMRSKVRESCRPSGQKPKGVSAETVKVINGGRGQK